MALQYKKTDSGKIDVDGNGNPLVFDDEEEEEKTFGLDAIHLYSKIPTLQAEAKTYREERDKLHQRMAPFGEAKPEDILAKIRRLDAFGDISPEKAKEALELVDNLKDVDEQNAVKIEKVKAGVADSYESRIRDIDTAHAKRVGEMEQAMQRKDYAIRNLVIKGAFDRSEFIRDATVLTPDIAYDSFGRYFVVEEGDDGLQVYALDRAGEKIFSKAKPGEYAEPEEAIELLINSYPQRDSILRSTGGGSGAGGNANQRASKRAKMAELASLPAVERLKALHRG